MAGPDGGTDRRARRLLPLREGLLFILYAVVLWFAVATVGSLYGGTGRGTTLSSRDRDVTATVRSCRREGPIGRDGFGFWWTCQVSIGVDAVEVRHSVATDADVGHTVRVHELCSSKDYTDCKYGRPRGLLWTGLIAALRLIEYFVLAALAFGTVIALKRVIRPRRIPNSQN
jgi:hypothetical protein